jgi:hypothetical protein
VGMPVETGQGKLIEFGNEITVLLYNIQFLFPYIKMGVK